MMNNPAELHLRIVNGDPARGARYNSALRYGEAYVTACFAIVLAEDGCVELIGGDKIV